MILMLVLDLISFLFFQANYDKYGAALLDVTRRFAEEKKALAPKKPVVTTPAPEPDTDWISMDQDDDSPYFEPDITFARGGKRRRRGGGSRKWNHKRARSASGGRSRGRGRSASQTTSTRGRGYSRGAASATSTRPATASSSHASTLMELPTNKSRFPRPKTFLTNL